MFEIQKKVHDNIKERQAEGRTTDGLRTFAVVPLHSPGAKHVLYDRAAFVELANRQVSVEKIGDKQAKRS